MALAKPEVKPTSPAVFGESVLKIPFFYKGDLSGKTADIKIFDIQNTLIKIQFSASVLETRKKDEYEAIFTFSRDEDGKVITPLNFGQFYKASICIVGDDEVSPWSNLTIFKQTSIPKVIRLAWSEAPESFFLNDTLFYTLTDDKTEVLEKVEYQYLVELSESLENFVPNVELPKEELFISESYDENFEYKIELKPIFDYPIVRDRILVSNDSTYVKIGISAFFHTKNGVFSYLTQEVEFSYIESSAQDPGYIPYVVEQQNSYGRVTLNKLDDLSYRTRIYNNLLLIGDFSSNLSFSDVTAKYLNEYTVFGFKYKKDIVCYRYAPVICDFNSVFLVDAKENTQLNITLNNSVNSFKYNVLETKTDTIGSQYPVFFRNPNTKYREFPLSGTISYHSLVSFGEEYGIDFTLPEIPHTNLTTDNLYAERVFREKVVEFLTKDRPLLYKSPTEGNIVVKLMNIQLTPNKTLGRMIYDFSCTCYEVQDLQSYIKECWK